MNKFYAKCCFKSHNQQYECTVVRGGVAFDGCLWQELAWLWEHGIKTVGCCCGHHVDSSSVAYIQVKNEDIGAMKELGYTMFYNSSGHPLFKPKTVIVDESQKFQVSRKYL